MLFIIYHSKNLLQVTSITASFSMQLTFMVEEEEQVQSFVAALLLWLYIIDVPEPLKYTVFRLEDTLVSFRELQ